MVIKTQFRISKLKNQEMKKSSTKLDFFIMSRDSTQWTPQRAAHTRVAFYFCSPILTSCRSSSSSSSSSWIQHSWKHASLLSCKTLFVAFPSILAESCVWPVALFNSVWLIRSMDFGYRLYALGQRENAVLWISSQAKLISLSGQLMLWHTRFWCPPLV